MLRNGIHMQFLQRREANILTSVSHIGNIHRHRRGGETSNPMGQRKQALLYFTKLPPILIKLIIH